MSNKAMTLVGDRSRAGKTDLLLLVRIADACDEEGRNAWLETPAMARWLRASERGAQYILQRLERNGEIEIEYNDEGRSIALRGGRTFQPKWFIHVRCICEWEAYQREEKPANSADSRGGLRPGRPRRKPAKSADLPKKVTRKVFAGKPQVSTQKPAKTGSAYKEGSGNDLAVDPEAASAGLTDADFEALRLAWNERTTWPLKPIDELTPSRRQRMTDALNERPLDQWCFIFDKVEVSTFLRGGGRQGFIARFEWVLGVDHAIAILEGQYDDHFSDAEITGAGARLFSATGGRCPHTPDCRSSQECVRKYALQLRQRAGAA